MIKHLLFSVALAGVLTAAACARDTAAQSSGTSPAAASAQPSTQSVDFDFPESAWRELDPENTLYIETTDGRIVVEMAPEFAPNHVERMRTLAHQHFYDFLVWHRVIDGFMAQGGGSRSQPNHRTDLPDMDAEFMVRRGAEMPVSELQDRVVNPSNIPQSAKAGFWHSFPVGTQTMALASLTGDGMVNSWLLHCEGAAAMARTNEPNSAGSQFYITRGDAEHLNAIYTSWGRVRAGQDAVDSIRVGTLGQDVGFIPDTINSMRVAADVPEDERTHVQVVDTDAPAFAEYLNSLRDAAGRLPDVCEITVPTRILE